MDRVDQLELMAFEEKQAGHESLAIFLQETAEELRLMLGVGLLDTIIEGRQHAHSRSPPEKRIGHDPLPVNHG